MPRNIKTYSPHLSPFPHSDVWCKSFHSLSLSIFTPASCFSDISTVLILANAVTENLLWTCDFVLNIWKRFRVYSCLRDRLNAPRIVDCILAWREYRFRVNALDSRTCEL